MTLNLNRRVLLAGLAMPLIMRPAAAQAPVTLDQLKQAGVIKVGLVNQPPYSALNPDGTIGGFVPTLVQQIMAKLGVEKVEPYVATYGELIPGLQARRWQMIAAAFRLTKDRCGQVLFTDPVTFDGGAIAYLDKNFTKAPASYTDLGGVDGKVGVLQASYIIDLILKAGVAKDRIMEFPSNQTMVDGLEVGRVNAIVSTNSALQQLKKQRGSFSVAYPVPEDAPVGSAPAFSVEDTDLHAQFQTELRAMRESGALQTMASEFGFDPPPANLVGISAVDACARL